MTSLIKLYRMSKNYSQLIPPLKKVRLDQWALIAQQKALEEQRAKQYESAQAEEKRRRMKQYLDAQIKQKQVKEEQEKERDKMYAYQAMRKVQEIEMMERQRKKNTKDRRKEVQNQNKYLFSDLVDSKTRSQSYSGPDYTMDIGYRAQQERRKKAQEAKRVMLDELDKQVKQKERYKANLVDQQKTQDRLNLSYQQGHFDSRKASNHRSYYQSPSVLDNYQKILQRQSQRDQLFDRSRIDKAAQLKRQEQLQKLRQKQQQKRESNQRVKQMLDQQVLIHQQRKRQQQRVNPQELSYGLLGRMLTNRNQKVNADKRQHYYQDLRKQIADREKEKEGQKSMTEEEYKINLNQLNRAVEGKFADQTYIDRSIHALSEPHSVNVNDIDGKVGRPEVQALRPTLDALKNRKKERMHSPDEFHYNKI